MKSHSENDGWRERARHSLKGSVEKAVVGLGGCRLARWLHPDRVAVLTYHNIVPERAPGLGDESLHLPVDVFSSQLREVAKTHDIVPLDELWSDRGANRRPQAVITFDDAYAGALHLGIREVVQSGLPATIFVSPGMLGRKQFWWDHLGEMEGLLGRERDTALQDCMGDSRLVLERYGVLDSGEFPGYARTCTMEELLEVSAETGISIGGHGWSHRNLTRLPGGDVRSELRRSLRWLKDQVPSAMIPFMSYPYGLTSPEVQLIAEEVGFLGGFLSGGGVFESSLLQRKPFGLPRVTIPRGLSLDGFRIRSAGIDVRREGGLVSRSGY